MAHEEHVEKSRVGRGDNRDGVPGRLIEQHAKPNRALVPDIFALAPDFCSSPTQ